MKWRYNSFDDATSRKIHSSNPFRLEARLARKKVLFHQDNTPSHKSTVAMTKLQIGLWIDSSSTLFSGFDPVWFLSKLKNLVRWEEILVKWGSRRQWVFCRLWDSLLQMTTKRELCVFSGWNLAWRGSKSGSFEMSRHQMDCSAIWKFIKLIKWLTYIENGQTLKKSVVLIAYVVLWIVLINSSRVICSIIIFKQSCHAISSY